MSAHRTNMHVAALAREPWSTNGMVEDTTDDANRWIWVGPGRLGIQDYRDSRPLDRSRLYLLLV